MSQTSLATASGLREALNLPASHEASLGPYAERGDRRCKQAIGSTAYAQHLAQTGDADEEAAAIYAANRFGASAYLLDRCKSAGSRGVVSAVQVGESSETLSSVEEVSRWARTLRDEAIRELKTVGIYVRPAMVVG